MRFVSHSHLAVVLQYLPEVMGCQRRHKLFDGVPCSHIVSPCSIGSTPRLERVWGGGQCPAGLVVMRFIAALPFHAVRGGERLDFTVNYRV